MMIKHELAQEVESVKLFQSINNFSQFKKNLQKLSNELIITNPLRWRIHADQQKNINNILGNGFELFCEMLVIHMGFHPHIGITNYVPIGSTNKKDYGCDAFAENINGEKSAVQCKFRSDSSTVLTANNDHLSNFLVQATMEGIDYIDKKPQRLFLFTTASGLHYEAVKQFKDSVLVINNRTINQLTVDNIIFWRSCEKLLKAQIGI